MCKHLSKLYMKRFILRLKLIQKEFFLINIKILNKVAWR